MIDLHTHILPGIDDGVGSLEEAVELARLELESGVIAIAATPHVRDDFPTTADAMEAAVASVRERLLREGVAVVLLSGGELALDRLDRLTAEDLRRFGLAGNPAYLLVETPYHELPLDLEQRLFDLLAAGVTPVLAHPERNADVRAHLDRLRRIVENGTLVQLTAASLDGRAGPPAKDGANAILDEGLAHIVASDAHSPGTRRGGLESVEETVGDAALARWLTVEVPGAIVEGRALPPRPARRPRSRRGPFRLRRR